MTVLFLRVCPRFRRLWPLSILFFILPLSGCRDDRSTRVLRVVDGDTLQILLPGKKTDTVRIIGIDAPETKDPRKPVQCFGPEASAAMHALADGKTITLETRPGDDRDKYHRLLRYASINGRDIGAEMIEEGYARSYRLFPHPRTELYNRLETEAKAAHRGLWAGCAKQSGGVHSSAN